jgi:hypothetical protein
MVDTLCRKPRRESAGHCDSPAVPAVDAAFLGSYRSEMRTRELGPTGRKWPIVGQGTWHLEESDTPAAIAALRRGIDLGMTHIDTAELYGAGRAEAIVG